MEDLQEVLGEHQDAVVTRDMLRDIGGRAHLAGENGFTYGFLAGLEQARGEQAREAYADVLSDTSSHKVRRWLSG
jgi:CHAD domain-containing protein